MDLNRRSRYEAGAQHDRRRLVEPLPLTQQEWSSVIARQTPYSSPLPQTQWSDLPVAYLPPDWPTEQRSEASSMVPEPLQPQRPQTVEPASRSRLHVPRQRRRPQPLSNESLARPYDPALLYPQLSPYDPPGSAASAPDQLQHFPRSVSQPNTPFYHHTTFEDTDLNIRPVPRTPTYPPTVSRTHSSRPSGPHDAAFDDEQEFRLFVEATAGLGPDPTLDHSSSSSASSIEQLVASQRSTASRQPTGRTMSSPTSETPTTMQAFAHVAQMPESRSISEAHRQRLQASAAGLDLRIPPSPIAAGRIQQRPQAQSSASTSSAPPTWIEVPEVSPIEEELPDYAASQAQAQAAQRVEALRRAAELQRRWKESRNNW